MANWRSLAGNVRAEEELAREVDSHLTLLADDFERCCSVHAPLYSDSQRPASSDSSR